MSRLHRRSLRTVTRHWRRLGAEDPMWAVYVAPSTRGGSWDTDEFFATGRAEIARVMSFVTDAGVSTPTRVAVDFGCGVGRLSQPLADRFERVIAVDVSEPMLAQARELSGAYANIDFRLNQRDDLGFLTSDSVDLVYSSLVLQHLPRHLAAGYLGEFLRVLSRDGVAVVQVA